MARTATTLVPAMMMGLLLFGALAPSVPAGHGIDQVVGGQCDTTGFSPDVQIEDFEFSPPVILISVGNVVEWVHVGAATHTTTERVNHLPLWDSGDMSNGDEYAVKFCATGDYKYKCKYHLQMLGTVRVV